MNHGLTAKMGLVNLLPRDGTVCLREGAIPVNEADLLLVALEKKISWREENAKIFGRVFPMPRLIAWYGDRSYKYSGLTHAPQPWTAELQSMREVAEQIAGQPFNTVLLNLYRHGQDSMGWHSDDEAVLGRNPVIASISLGAERFFHLRPKDNHRETIKLPLPHGSCLVMAGETQHRWQHALPKTRRLVKVRINLTFRWVG